MSWTAGAEKPKPSFRQRRGRAVFAISAALALLSGCAFPTHDPSVLRGIKAESQILMATWPTKTYVTVPKSRWPRTIAGLRPAFVTVSEDGVDIWTKPYFDGGWGYFVVRNGRKPPIAAERLTDLGEGVYWYRDG